MLPYLVDIGADKGLMPTDQWSGSAATAITSLGKYNPFEQIVGLGEGVLYNYQITWADFIVFPFTTDDLSKDNYWYQAIREIKPSCKIVFSVDYDFYNLPDGHKMKELFSHPQMVKNVEKNMLFADLVFTTNYHLSEFLVHRVNHLVTNEYKSALDSDKLHLSAVKTIGYNIDRSIVTENIINKDWLKDLNIDEDIYKPISVSTIAAIASASQSIKKKDIVEKEKEPTDWNSILKVVKVKSDWVVKQTGVKKPIAIKKTKLAAETALKAEIKKRQADENKPPIKSASTTTKKVQSAITPSLVEKPIVLPDPTEKLEKTFAIGIICNGENNTDLMAYNPQLKKLNELYGSQVRLILIGYDKDGDTKNSMNGVVYEYVKPVSIIHYFKQIEALNLDFVLILASRSEFNIRSENISRFLEAGIFGIPCIAPNQYPYQQTIATYQNGYLYPNDSPDKMVAGVIDALRNSAVVSTIKQTLASSITAEYGFTDNNIDEILSAYNV